MMILTLGHRDADLGEDLKVARLATRSAVSLMEVIFAMSVLLVGLLGLASVMGVASNNATIVDFRSYCAVD